MNDLVQFIDNCDGVTVESPTNQVPMWPTTIICAGEIGLVLQTQYYEEVGFLCEVLIGSEVFFDVPKSKFQII